MSRVVLGLDVGSNSVGSAWVDLSSGDIVAGVSVFPAGVDESDEKRGDPKNAKRRMTRRTRITLSRRAQRKRALRLRLIEAGLLPATEDEFERLVAATDPWELRRRGLDEPLSAYEFGRVLLHLAQRRGALGLRLAEEDAADGDADGAEEGRVKAAIGTVKRMMRERSARTFGEYIAMVRAERVEVLRTPDSRRPAARVGRREWRRAVRNKAGSYEHCADRAMIREEFSCLWDTQTGLGSPAGSLLTDTLRRELDDEQGDTDWRHRGLLFGQRRQSWDLGTLGRCTLEPTERCVPHADMYASRYRVVETLNILRVIERGRPERCLTVEERSRLNELLSGPLGTHQSGRLRGRPKTTVSATDLRQALGWGRATATTPLRLNVESDADRAINTDWFHREIVHGAITVERWTAMPHRLREGINRAILRFDPDEEDHAEKLRSGVIHWAGLSEPQADALVAAWRRRPRLDSKRLRLSRKAVRNLLTIMDRSNPMETPAGRRWPTEIEARKVIAEDAEFADATTGRPLDPLTRRRYATGAKGATARDRHYMGKHVLTRNGQPIIDCTTGQPLAEPPPAPLITNPVVRKAVHEVRRHLVEYMTRFGRRPDEIYIELAREARMGKLDSDRLLFKNRLRNRIRNDILQEFDLHSASSTQQRAAVDRVVLCAQQGGRCPLCGEAGLTARQAAAGEDCEVAHILPRASGGHNGLANIVLAHSACNRNMGRRTPRQFWIEGPGFDRGMQWVEAIYQTINRPSASELRSATGEPLWKSYFTAREDIAKIEQFKRDITDIQGMTERQEAATKYAARQLMTYLADALYDGSGLPERGGQRRIFATDGLWTGRLRREWGLHFDPHQKRAHGISSDEEGLRREKDRGDHRHHAVDAIVIALSTRSVQSAWEERDRAADRAGVNTADEAQLENYRRNNPLELPGPFRTRDDFRAAVRRAVYGEGDLDRPICHRPVKRKLIGALHEETLFGPVLDASGQLTSTFTAKKQLLDLKPNHLRMPEGWDELEAELRRPGTTPARARELKRQLAALPDPPPEKSGIVRDRALRAQMRRSLRELGLDPDAFTANDIKRLAQADSLRHESGIPIRSFVLLRTINDPVIIPRRRPEHGSTRRRPDPNPASQRGYVGGNNHHIEIRATVTRSGREKWTGSVVTAFEAAQRKLRKLRAFREAGVPKPKDLAALPIAERRRWRPVIARIEAEHPIVDRSDHETEGRFIMSLCEGETLLMRHKSTNELGYFVVAKIDKPQSVFVVPHWDARAASLRRDAEGRPVPHSTREQFAVTPRDLLALAPPDHPHAVKVHVTPLGTVSILERD